MNKLLLLFLSSILLVSCQTTQRISFPETLPLSNQVTFGQFDNGLSYYIQPNNKPTERAYVTLLLNVGSLQEQDGVEGIAHFVEHMAFNGSTHFDKNQLISVLEGLGMEFGSDINAFTSFDNTRYHLEFPTDNAENWQTIETVLLDWIRGIEFSEEEVDKERKVILSERRNYSGLGERLSNILIPINFAGSQHAKRMPIGTQKSLHTINSLDLKKFYSSWYQPQNIAIIVTGDVKPQEFIAKFNATIGQLEQQNELKPDQYLIPQVEETHFKLIQDPEILSTSMQQRYQVASVTLNSMTALRYRLLNQMMLTLFNHRMFELSQSAEKPFESASLSYSQLGLDKLLFSFSVSPKENEYEQAYFTLLEEIERVKQHGFLKSEVNRYTLDILMSSKLALEDQQAIHSASLSQPLMNHFLYGEHFLSADQRHQLLSEVLPTITAQELHQHFLELIKNEPHSFIVYSPQHETHDSDVASLYQQGFEKQFTVTPYYESDLESPIMETLPVRGSIVSKEAIMAVDAIKYHLSNGIEVIIRPSDLSNTEVLLSAFSPGGYSLANEQQQRSAMESAKLVAASGIGPYSRTDLGKKLSNKSVRINLNISRYFSNLSASSTPKDLDTLFQLIHLYFTQPKLDESVAKNHQESVIKYQRNRLNDPENLFYDELHTLLTDYHPKSLPWSVEAAKTLDRQIALDFYKQRFSKANNFTFVIVGNIDPQKLEPLLEQYIASLPSQNAAEIWQDEKIRTKQQNITFKRSTSLDGKTKVNLRYHRPIAQYITDTRFNLGFYRELLEQELQQVLREDLGGVYSVSVSASVSRYPVEWFNLSIGFNCDPEREQELISTTKKLVEKTLKQKLSQESLDNIKSQRRVAFEEATQSNSFWLNQIHTYERDDIDYHYFTNYLSRVENVDIDAIQQTAIMLFNDSYLIESIMSPKDITEQVD